jgi:glycogen synthase
MLVHGVCGAVLHGSVNWWTFKILTAVIHLYYHRSHSDVLHCHQYSTQMIPVESELRLRTVDSGKQLSFEIRRFTTEPTVSC